MLLAFMDCRKLYNIETENMFTFLFKKQISCIKFRNFRFILLIILLTNFYITTNEEIVFKENSS